MKNKQREVTIICPDLGTRLSQRQKELHISSEALAEQINISSNHLSAIRTSKMNPSLKVVLGLCEALNVTPDYLLLGTVHAINLPKDIVQKLSLVDDEYMPLLNDIVETFISNSQKSHN